jgi:hypothetical protein
VFASVGIPGYAAPVIAIPVWKILDWLFDPKDRGD